jgi:hypothetical protein
MARIISTSQGLALQVSGNESAAALEETLLDHAESTMANNAPSISVEYPVIEKNEIRDEQIGWVSISIRDSEYELRHYSIERTELAADWNARNFYRGEYGFKAN